MKHVKEMTIAATFVLLTMLLWGLSGCEKEPEPVKEECKCGTVYSSIPNQMSDGSTTQTYSTIVTNDCTGNQRNFFTDHKNIGDKYCWNQQW